MRRHFVSGLPSAFLSLSQEKSSGVEIVDDQCFVLKLSYDPINNRKTRFCFREEMEHEIELPSW